MNQVAQIEEIEEMLREDERTERFKGLEQRRRDIQLQLRAIVDDALALARDSLKDGGDTEEESQLLCVVNALLSVDSAINGITHNDVKGGTDG